MSSDKIAQRILKEVGIADLDDVLAERIAASDLHSLLLRVCKRKVTKVAAAQLLKSDPVVEASTLDARLLHQVVGIAYEAGKDFEALDLSPVNALGTMQALTKLDQGSLLSTIRAYECSPDPTHGLTLECARRRKPPASRQKVMRVCTLHRCLRFPAPTLPGWSAHFALFGLVTAGRDTGSSSFEMAALRQHIAVYLRFLEALPPLDFVFKDCIVELSDTRAVSFLCEQHKVDLEKVRTTVRARDAVATTEAVLQQHEGLWAPDAIPSGLPDPMRKRLELLESQVMVPLLKEFPHVTFRFNMHRLTGLGYYQGPCYHLKLAPKEGDAKTISDGGFTDWTQQLLNDSKERLLTSAIGIELLCKLFRTAK